MEVGVIAIGAHRIYEIFVAALAGVLSVALVEDIVGVEGQLAPAGARDQFSGHLAGKASHRTAHAVALG